MPAQQSDAAQRFALGTRLAQEGRHAEAESVLAALAAVYPRIAEAHWNLALMRERLGSLTAAAEAYRAYLALRPEDPAGLINLAVVLRRSGGDLREAEQLLRRAAAFSPETAEAQAELGLTLFRAGRTAEAEPIFQRALALDPRHYDGLNNLGLVLDRLGRRDEAEEMLRRAIASAPERGEAVTNLAALLRVAKRPADAEAVLRAALPALELYPGVLRELGMAAEEQQRYEEAIELYERAIALDPDDGDARECLGSMLLSLARYKEAQAAYEAAIERKPEKPGPHFSLGCILLLQQEFARGWREYERRLDIEGMAAMLAQVPGPRWTGEPLAGRRILLRGEQGAGDTLIFARYVPEVAALGGEVVLEVQAPLKRLMSRLAGVKEIVTQAEPVPPHDLQAMLGSLPLLLGRDAPSGAPYLSADSERAAYWRQRLGPRQKPRVGLVWAGNPKQASDPQRSIGLAPLVPLLDIEGVEFLSLQVGPRSADITALGLGKRLRDISGELTDYAETAAALAEIDLLISSDTSAPHLAGALGRPCWVLLGYSADWRWQQRRSDSPWFSSLRLFRQPRLGDWASVVREVGAALAAKPN